MIYRTSEDDRTNMHSGVRSYGALIQITPEEQTEVNITISMSQEWQSSPGMPRHCAAEMHGENLLMEQIAQKGRCNPIILMRLARPLIMKYVAAILSSPNGTALAVDEVDLLEKTERRLESRFKRGFCFETAPGFRAFVRKAVALEFRTMIGAVKPEETADDSEDTGESASGDGDTNPIRKAIARADLEYAYVAVAPASENDHAMQASKAAAANYLSRPEFAVENYDIAAGQVYYLFKQYLDGEAAAAEGAAALPREYHWQLKKDHLGSDNILIAHYENAQLEGSTLRSSVQAISSVNARFRKLLRIYLQGYEIQN